MSLIKTLKGKKLKDYSYVISKYMFTKITQKRRYPSKYEFINRSKGSKNLMLIVAGFQEWFWDAVSERVLMNVQEFDEEIDVCVCIPQGLDTTHLREICEKNQWSLVRIERDLLAQVQNIAIDLHKNAEWIYKIDEDIILSHNYFAKLKKAHMKALNEMPVMPGLVVPCINVNAYGAVTFMKTMGLEAEYKDKFGRYTFGCPFYELYLGDKVHSDPEVGRWIWSKTVPFDETASIMEEKNEGMIGWCPHRFSIGAILITRRFWDQINGFEVGHEEEMGREEEQICGLCARKNYGIYVAEDTFVGHLGFGKQKDAVKDFFMEHENEIRLK